MLTSLSNQNAAKSIILEPESVKSEYPSVCESLKADTELVTSNEGSIARTSPSSVRTPTKDSFSPGSTEPISMPSDKSSSRVPSEDKGDLNYMTDNEKSISDASMSPFNYPDRRQHSSMNLPYDPGNSSVSHSGNEFASNVDNCGNPVDGVGNTDNSYTQNGLYRKSYFNGIVNGSNKYSHGTDYESMQYNAQKFSKKQVMSNHNADYAHYNMNYSSQSALACQVVHSNNSSSYMNNLKPMPPDSRSVWASNSANDSKMPYDHSMPRTGYYSDYAHLSSRQQYAKAYYHNVSDNVSYFEHSRSPRVITPYNLPNATNQINYKEVPGRYNGMMLNRSHFVQKPNHHPVQNNVESWQLDSRRGHVSPNLNNPQLHYEQLQVQAQRAAVQSPMNAPTSVRKRGASGVAGPKHNKRKRNDAPRNVHPSDMSTVVSTAESVLKAAFDDPKTLLRNPCLETIGNILPPTPAPRFINPNVENTLPRRLHPEDSLTCEEVCDHWGMKYDSHTYDIKWIERDISTGESKRPDSLLYEHLLCLKDKKSFELREKITRDNFFHKASDKSFMLPDDDQMIITPTPPASPSKDSAKSIDLLEFDDKSDGRVTPPMKCLRRIRNKTKVDKKTESKMPVQNSTLGPGGFPETVLKLHSLKIKDTSMMCGRCALPIVPQANAIIPKSNDTNMYCCISCMKNNGPKAMHSKINCEISNSGMNTVLTNFDNPLISVPIVIQTQLSSQQKLNKVLMKKSAESKCRRKSGDDPALMMKKWKNVRWFKYSPSKMYMKRQQLRNVYPSLMDHSSSLKFSLNVAPGHSDTRTCKLCGISGEGSEDINGRLLNINPLTWVHLNCSLWCYDTYETVCGSLVNVSKSILKASKVRCSHCDKLGAGLPCFQAQCQKVYHVPCAFKNNCVFYSNRGMYCPSHYVEDPSVSRLDDLIVNRKVYIERDEEKLVADVLLKEDDVDSSKQIIRIGSLLLNNVGQLLPEQLSSGHFHSSNYIYPVGYCVTRFYWSYRLLQKRCRYQCCIEEIQFDCSKCKVHSGKCTYPFTVKFTIKVIEDGFDMDTYEGNTCSEAWSCILSKIDSLRRNSGSGALNLYPKHVNCEMLYGLNEPHIVRAIESLPGIDHLTNYVFKFGHTQLISEMPLAINPTGCARAEPKLRTYVRRRSVDTNRDGVNRITIMPQASQSMRSDLGSQSVSLGPKNTWILQSKSHQYRRLRTEWKTNVLLGRSRIQGLGLYAARDLEKHSFIIEYLGEKIRNEVANKRERLYELQNRGIYMFRADDDCIVDATMCGGLARYVNHSCEPSCIAEVVNFDHGNHIIIIASRKIEKGEELTYDYKFDFEEDKPNERIPCLCGARTCRKWMN